jgi:hypothetical protein
MGAVMAPIKTRAASALLASAAALACAASAPAQVQQRVRLEQFWAEIPPSKETLESPSLPRTHDGLPDFFSQWQPNWRTLAPNGQHVRQLTAEDQIHPDDFATEARYLEWVNRDLNTSPSNACIPNGAARFFSNPYLVEFTRTGENAIHDQIVMIDEIHHGIRHVFMSPDVELETNRYTRGNWGVSRGEWQDRSGDGEMDTLVVNTDGLTANWIDQTGLTHEDGATLTEEFWLSEDGAILHMLWTLEDPATYAHPIKQHFWFDRPTDAESAIYEEYICSFDSAEPDQLLERYQNAADQRATE